MRSLTLIPIILACFAGMASAAGYPDHPIRLIVPQAAGSATDNTARILAAELSKELGQLVIVDDRPDFALMLGLDLVAKSPPRRSGPTPPNGARSSNAPASRSNKSKQQRQAGCARRGDFQHKFRVFDRENEPCPNCKDTIKHIVQNGRSPLHCPAARNECSASVSLLGEVG